MEQMIDEYGEEYRVIAETTMLLDQQMLVTRPSLTELAKLKSTMTTGLRREIYSAGNTRRLRRHLLRVEGGRSVPRNPGANKVYDFFGDTYKFYDEVYGRNSIDDRGMKMIATVDLGPNYANAFWNGQEMGYGTGDGFTFKNFTDSLDVIAHELTHGVIDFNGNGGLAYNGQVGALNESFADIFGSLAKQYKNGDSAGSADWELGKEIMLRAPNMRSLKDPSTGFGSIPDGPNAGTPGQPKHMSEIYLGSSDNHGVHINSGIPNHAFYHFATMLGGNAWERAGQVWYDTLTRGNLDPGVFGDPNSGEQFQTFAEKTMKFAGGSEKVALKKSWAKVGIVVAGPTGPKDPDCPSGESLKEKLTSIRKQLEKIIENDLS